MKQKDLEKLKVGSKIRCIKNDKYTAYPECKDIKIGSIFTVQTIIDHVRTSSGNYSILVKEIDLSNSLIIKALGTGTFELINQYQII